jgi:Domain of Unknown Function (DUF1080)
MKTKKARFIFSPGLITCFVILGALALSLSCSSVPPNPQKEIEGFRDTPMLPGGKWHMHDPDRPQPPVVTPGAKFDQGAPPPSDAEVLFDGKSLAKWQTPDGHDANWLVRDGYTQVTGPGDIRTRENWADFQLHVEFCEPNPPGILHGQDRGNSGILINNSYEVQIVDSYHDKTYPDGQAGAVYGQMPPLVNAMRPPGQWQTYDIIWESPRWDSTNGLAQKAAVTVLLNGVVVQHHTELIGKTDGIGTLQWKRKSFYTPHPPEVFVELQSHNINLVRFRNIWIRDLHIATRQ